MRITILLKILTPILFAAAALYWWLGDFEARIVIDRKTEFQTIRDWESLTPAHWGQPRLETYRDELFRAAYVDLGLNRFRLEVRSGVEAPVDEHARMVAKEIPFSEYRKYWYRPVNDDDDPRHINAAGFHFTELDGSVERVVLPLRKIMAAEGRELRINLCYVSFSRQSLKSTVHLDPEEYAEFALATLLHLKEKYDFVPETWQVHLEPDAAPGWTAKLLGQAIAASGRRFKEAGFDLRFIGPSTTSAANAVPYLKAMIAEPGVKELMTELSYHRYRGVDDEVLEGIGSAARANGLNSAMLELIGAGHEVLHEDLEKAMVSSWMPYSIGGPSPKASPELFWIDETDPENPVLHENPEVRFLRQYLRYVQRGAVRIGAESDDRACRPLAFTTPEGKLVVVLDCKKAGRFSFADLPAGRYVVEYSTQEERAKRLPETSLKAKGELEARIPAPGVATLIQLD